MLLNDLYEAFFTIPTDDCNLVNSVTYGQEDAFIFGTLSYDRLS